MNDFNNRNNLDYQRDPLDSKNLTGIYWSDVSRKVEAPILNREMENNKLDSSINSVTFIGFIFLGLMGLTWVYRLLYNFFVG